MLTPLFEAKDQTIEQTNKGGATYDAEDKYFWYNRFVFR